MYIHLGIQKADFALSKSRFLNPEVYIYYTAPYDEEDKTIVVDEDCGINTRVLG
jgi:hypothetical protein